VTSDSTLMPSQLPLGQPGQSGDQPRRVLAAWQRPVAAGLALAGAALAWLGGWAAMVGVLAVLAAAWLAWHGMAHTGPTPAQVAHEDAGRHGAEVMVSQVVPVWSRQMEVTRDAAAEGLNQILESFANMSGALGSLTDNLSNFAVHADPGAVDGAVRRESPALDALAAASQRAFAERDALVAELGRCVTGLAELQQLAKNARELARHTRLVAFNASIEANRQGNRAEGGSQAVANELRMLSGRMGETGDRIERVVQGLITSAAKARRQGEINDTSPEELRLEIDLCARQALQALLGGMGSSLQSSAEVEQASRTLRDQLDAAFVHFQFGDRVSQMLSIVGNDMSNFARWVAANPRATQTDAAEWLASLEASYTMNEQRATHHGNVAVDVGSNVDFF
jgi:methyl-accepting chemotaxis protein